MRQKDDRKYSFVVTHQTRNLIRIRRIEISKQIANSVAAFAVLTVGIGGYGIFHNRFKPTSAQASAQAETQDSACLTFSNLENYKNGEGGPEITETPLPASDFGEKNFEQSLRDSEFMPSIYPLIGKINDEFGWRHNPFGGYSSEFHPGLDIKGEKGDSIIAPANGRVLKAGWSNGYGNMIEIDHGNNLTTRYGHLSEIDVEAGQEILRGQQIGKVGSTGRSTGPHLHYEVRINGEAVNPHDYLPPDASSVVQP
jgi:murein DD-endopeptidase MepM/ murein hydrolase activator NlpD